MSTLPLLIEIGTEEIPDWMIVSAVTQFRETVEKALNENALGGKVRLADATPRRIALIVDDVVERQADREELVMGPPKAAAYKDGKPTGAALGFAKKNGVDVSALHIEASAKGEYVAVRRNVQGKAASEILSALIPEAILKIYFPKTMYWTGRNGPRFIRPIRWIVAVHGATVIPFELAGVASGNTTYGHRRMSSGALTVDAGNYVDTLGGAGVIVSSAARRQR